ELGQHRFGDVFFGLDDHAGLQGIVGCCYPRTSRNSRARTAAYRGQLGGGGRPPPRGRIRCSVAPLRLAMENRLGQEGHTSDSCSLSPPIVCSLLPTDPGGKDVQERICFAS